MRPDEAASLGARLHNEWVKRERDLQYPEKKKVRHAPSKEELMNIDNRIPDTMLLLLTEKERKVHFGFHKCDIEKLPLFGIGTKINSIEDFKNVGEFALIGIASSNPEIRDTQCMGEDLLEALNLDFQAGKYKIDGKQIPIVRLDQADLTVKELAKNIGLKLNSDSQTREPHLVFYYKNEFFHWSQGWLRYEKVKVLNWINKIVNPFKTISTHKQIIEFQKVDIENRETSEFFRKDYPSLGSFYEDTEQKTRVLVLDTDEQEVHDANEAAKHLADRHDLRFGYSDDDEVMVRFDKDSGLLSKNKEEFGNYEALVTINHAKEKIGMGLHMRHSRNLEQSIKDFVNRESVSILDDLNADTILTFGMQQNPLLLVFVDLDLWEKDKEEAEHQRHYIDEVQTMVYQFAHHKVVGCMVPIDDTENGNQAIREMFGVHDKSVHPAYPQIVLLNPHSGKFAPYLHNFQTTGKVTRPTWSRIELWINEYESAYSKEYEQLDMNKVKQMTDNIYKSMPRISREEMYQLEKEFDEKYPVNSVKMPEYDIEAKKQVEEMYRQMLEQESDL